MDIDSYAAFLPLPPRNGDGATRSTWLPWRRPAHPLARAGAPGAPVRAILVHGGGRIPMRSWPLAGPVWSPPTRRSTSKVLATRPTAVRLHRGTRPGSVRYRLDRSAVRHPRRRRTGPRRQIRSSCSAAAPAWAGCWPAYEIRPPDRPGEARYWRRLSARHRRSRRAPRGGPSPRPSDASVPRARASIHCSGRGTASIRWLADMSAMSNDPALSRLCAADPRGGGARVPLGFLSGSGSTIGARRRNEISRRTGHRSPPAADAGRHRAILRFLQQISGTRRRCCCNAAGAYPIEERTHPAGGGGPSGGAGRARARRATVSRSCSMS